MKNKVCKQDIRILAQHLSRHLQAESDALRISQEEIQRAEHRTYELFQLVQSSLPPAAKRTRAKRKAK